MTEIGLIGLISGASLGLIFVVRPWRTMILLRRLEKIVRSVELEAETRRKALDPELRHFIEATQGLMVAIPLVASGRIGSPLNHKSDITDPRAEELFNYIDRNAWLAPFFMAARACLLKACSLGHPLEVRRWDRYWEAFLQLTFSSESNGSIRLVPNRKEMSEFEKGLDYAYSKVKSAREDKCGITV